MPQSQSFANPTFADVRTLAAGAVRKSRIEDFGFLPALSDGQFYQWDGDFNVLVAADLPGDPALGDLTDVTLTSPDSNSVLKFNGTVWVDDFVDWTELTGKPTSFAADESLDYTWTGVHEFPNGSVSVPSIAFSSDPDCGFYYTDSAGQQSVHVAAGGAEVMRWTNFSGVITVVAFVADVTTMTADTSTTLTTPYVQLEGASGSQVEIRIDENSTNGSNRLTIFGPDSVASDFSLTLPDAAGSADESVVTDASGELSFEHRAKPVLFGYASADSAENASAKTAAFDTFPFAASGFSYTNSSGEITINTAGTYRIEAHVGVSTSWTSYREAVVTLELDTGSGFAAVAGTTAKDWIRNAITTSTGLVTTGYVTASVGDKIRVRMTPTSSIFIVGGATRIELTKVA